MVGNSFMQKWGGGGLIFEKEYEDPVAHAFVDKKVSC